MDNDTDSQMDQPATPTRIGAATASPNDPEHGQAPSPDPPSTRPNPFDDSDLSARKRRRTSGSASPPPSSVSPTQSPSGLAPADTSSAVINPGTSKTNPDKQPGNPDAAPPAAEKSELPHTPKSTTTCSAKSSSPTPLSSSKVTINLRRLGDPGHEAAAKTSLSPDGGNSPARVNSDITSDGEQNMVVDHMLHAMSAEQTPDMSDSGSPAVELIAISDDEDGESDDEMTFSVDGQRAARILSKELLSPDPTFQFPYIQRNEEPSLPLLRFIHHFKAGQSLNLSHQANPSL
jgi:ubiquitin carboxyl-terminal hydrolase 34